MKFTIVTLVLLLSQNLWASLEQYKGIYQLSPVLFDCPICLKPEIEEIDEVDVIDINDDTISLDLMKGQLRAETLVADTTGVKGEYATNDGVMVRLSGASAQPTLQLRTAIDGSRLYQPVFTKK